MNTDDRQSACERRDGLESPRPQRHPARPYIFLCAGLCLLLLWAYWSRVQPIRPSDDAGGPGHTLSGAAADGPAHGGTGTGTSGAGPGAGNQGAGSGMGGEHQVATQAQAAAGGGGTAPQANQSGSSGTGLASSGSERGVTPQEAAPTQRTESLNRDQPRPSEAAAADRGTASGAPEGRRGFYGVEVSESGRVLFLVDMSGSMGAMSREQRGKQLIDVLRMELKKAIYGGPTITDATYRRRGGFIIIGFDHEHRKFPRQGLCRYRDRGGLKEASQFIENDLEARGGTLMRPAWAEAVEQINANKIDTVYFLTDGYDNQGMSADELLELLKKHISRRVTVHCFALGADQSFMRKVAETRNGRYIFLP